MNILDQELAAGQRVLLVGPPGCGKTARVNAAFAAAGIPLTTWRASLMERVDVSGGWSRGAKHRPQPVVVRGEVESCPQSTVHSPVVGGHARRKFTAFDLSTTPPTLIRRDYALADLREQGGKLPELYFDELGNMRGGNDEIVMEGPHGGPNDPQHAGGRGKL